MFVDLHTTKGAILVCLSKLMFITENKNGCRIFFDDGTYFDILESYQEVSIRLLASDVNK